MTVPCEVSYWPTLRPTRLSTLRYWIRSFAQNSISVSHRLEQNRYFVASPPRSFDPPRPYFIANSRYSTNARSVGFWLLRSQKFVFTKYSTPPVIDWIVSGVRVCRLPNRNAGSIDFACSIPCHFFSVSGSFPPSRSVF